MIVDFKCEKCGYIEEEYYSLSSQVPTYKKCKCGEGMKRLFGGFKVRMGAEISGYEKENEGKLTLGKAVDMKQRWV